MKAFFAPFLVLAVLVAPVKAYTILPYLYAKTYCELRRFGADHNSAIRAALSESRISGNNWTYITVAGNRHRSDIFQAAIAAVNLCRDLVP